MLPNIACFVKALFYLICRLPALTKFPDVVAHASLISPPRHKQLADICILPVRCAPQNARVVPLYDMILLFQSLIVVTLDAIVQIGYKNPLFSYHCFIRRHVGVAFPRPLA